MAAASTGAPISSGKVIVNLSPTMTGMRAYTAKVYVLTSPFVKLVCVILKDVIGPATFISAGRL